MKQIDLTQYVCHGLSGIRRGGEFLNVPNNIQDIIQAELEQYDSHWDKRLKATTGNGIIHKYFEIKYCEQGDIWAIYRLLHILKRKKIETFEDIQKRQDEVIINRGRQLGCCNKPNDICFSKREEDFYQGMYEISFSCDTGGSYYNFIEDGISLVLPYDDKFKSYPKSTNLDGVFRDELRINGSISKPNIFAISLPLTSKIKNIKKTSTRPYRLEFYKNMIIFIREMLKIFEYHDVYIIDSITGYNLEDRNIIKAYKLAINQGEYDPRMVRDIFGGPAYELRYPDDFEKDLKNFVAELEERDR